jgi:hypothetical protein
MSKARSTGNIGNIIKTSATCVTVNDGTTDLLIMSGSGTVTIPGNLVVLGGIAGSSAESSSYSLSSSFATNANTLDGIDGASFLQTGSFNTFSSSIDTTIKNKLNGDGVISGSVQVDITNTTGYSTFSSSLSSSIGSLSGSVATTTSGLSSSIGSLSSSVATNTSGLAGRIGTIEGNYATTGSNIFVGSQVITGSLYITNDMVVQGCSCLQNITASAVSIGTNTVVLNTATPAVRFAGISVQDSGSNAGVTGSIYWDGLCNKWIYSNPSTVGYSGGMLISGPRNTGTIGSESPLTCNYIAKSGGGDHIYDSCIIDDGTTVCINANLKGSGTACFTSAICSCASSTLYSYFDGNNTVLPNPTDRPHIFRTSSGGLGLSANNEGVGSQPISMFTCGAQRFTILPNGNVGVNTNTPLSLLDVNLLSEGARRLFVNYDDSLVTIKSANSSQTAETLRVWGDNIIFNVTSVGSGVEAMRITNTCRVGIGTPTPCTALHISNPAPYIYLTDTSTNGTRPTARIINGDVGTCQSLNFGFACNDGTTSGLDVITLNEKGNVGIGTNSPGTNLEICTPSQNCGNIRIYNGFNNGTNCFGLEFFRNYDAASNEIGGHIKYIRTGGSSGDLIFGIGERGSVNNRLRIEYNGVSCFSSDVCVGGNLVVNGGTIGVGCNTTTNSDARINFYTRSASTGDRVAMYGYNLCAPTSNNEITYQALGFCTINNQGYVNFQTKNTSAWCNTMILINGRVGIGTNSPTDKLHVVTDGITASAPQYSWPSYNSEADSNSRRIIFETAGNNLTGTAGYGASLSLVLGNYWDSRVIITPVGSGGASPGDQGTGHGKDILIKGGTSDNGAGYKGGRLYLNGGVGYQSGYGANVGHIIMQTIGSGGRVGIGTTSPDEALHVTNPGSDTVMKLGGGGAARDTNFTMFSQSAGNTVQAIHYNGNMAFFSNKFNIASNGSASLVGSLTQNTSDIRLKTNITTIENAIEKIKQLSGFTYNWNTLANELGGFDTTIKEVGVSAQSVKEVVPEAVFPAPFDNKFNPSSQSFYSNSGENYLTVQYEKLVPLLIEGIKEQQCTINTLKTCLGIN